MPTIRQHLDNLRDVKSFYFAPAWPERKSEGVPVPPVRRRGGGSSWNMTTAQVRPNRSGEMSGVKPRPPTAAAILDPIIDAISNGDCTGVATVPWYYDFTVIDVEGFAKDRAMGEAVAEKMAGRLGPALWYHSTSHYRDGPYGGFHAWFQLPRSWSWVIKYLHPHKALFDPDLNIAPNPKLTGIPNLKHVSIRLPTPTGGLPILFDVLTVHRVFIPREALGGFLKDLEAIVYRQVDTHLARFPYELMLLAGKRVGGDPRYRGLPYKPYVCSLARQAYLDWREFPGSIQPEEERWRNLIRSIGGRGGQQFESMWEGLATTNPETGDPEDGMPETRPCHVLPSHGSQDDVQEMCNALGIEYRFNVRSWHAEVWSKRFGKFRPLTDEATRIDFLHVIEQQVVRLTDGGTAKFRPMLRQYQRDFLSVFRAVVFRKGERFDPFEPVITRWRDQTTPFAPGEGTLSSCFGFPIPGTLKLVDLYMPEVFRVYAHRLIHVARHRDVSALKRFPSLMTLTGTTGCGKGTFFTRLATGPEYHTSDISFSTPLVARAKTASSRLILEAVNATKVFQRGHKDRAEAMLEAEKIIEEATYEYTPKWENEPITVPLSGLLVSSSNLVNPSVPEGLYRRLMTIPVTTHPELTRTVLGKTSLDRDAFIARADEYISRSMARALHELTTGQPVFDGALTDQCALQMWDLTAGWEIDPTTRYTTWKNRDADEFDDIGV